MERTASGPVGGIGRRWVVLGASAAAATAFAQPAPATFTSGYAGSLPKAASDKARTYFSQPAVRALVEALSRAPLEEAEAARRLAGTPATLDDLVRLRLVRREGGRVWLAFAYFTAADMALVHRTAAEFAPGLALAYRRRAAEFAALWRRYPVRTVDPKVLAFVLISGVGLNWDGLDILYEGGWRRPILVTGPDWRYSFFAEADTPGWSYKAYYWGSSAFPGDAPIAMPAAFASFGDAVSDPRQNLPDLLGLAAKDMSPPVRAAAQAAGFRDDPMLGPGVLGLDAGRELGRLLLALRAAPASAKELSATQPVEAELQLLQAIGYARPGPDGRWALTAPVLDAADRPMLEGARALNRRILRAWIIGNQGAIRRRLAGLSALRQGVPYAGLFTQIWHEIFGLATRELVAAGVTADPYAPGNPSPGSLGMAWRPDLIQRVWR